MTKFNFILKVILIIFSFGILAVVAETYEFENVMRKRSAQNIDFSDLLGKGIQILKNNRKDVGEQIAKTIKTLARDNNQGIGR